MSANHLPGGPSEAPPLSPRAERKLAQMIDGARAVMIAKGFEGASVDDIAREAGISKATMYRYFPDKSALFAAVMSRECARQAGAAVDLCGCPGPIETTLRDFATQHLAFVLSECAIEGFRAAVAESARFPDLAQDFFDRRIAKARAVLAPALAAAAERGDLAIDDVPLAASQFLALCKTDLFYLRLFGMRGPLGDEELTGHAARAVEAFLRIYRPSASAGRAVTP